MKTLKFRNELTKLIISGKKNTTWRLFDDKNLSAGDEVSLLIWESSKEFAKIKVLSVRETTFGELTKEDWQGHETYESDEKMYEVFSSYYNRPVTSESPVKVLLFELL